MQTNSERRAFTKLAELSDTHAKMKLEFQEKAKALFKEATLEFFKLNPGVTGFTWTQYTPYFNDGEACLFGVGEPTFTNAPDPQSIEYDDYVGESEMENLWASSSVECDLKKVLDRKPHCRNPGKAILAAGGVDVQSCEQISKFIVDENNADILLDMFGDHVKVVATRQGFEVCRHSHD